MSVDAADLPNDPEALRAMIAAMQAETAQLRTETAAQNALLLETAAELAEARGVIDDLRFQLARAKRLQFGAASEKLDRLVEQLELQLEDLEEEEGETIARLATLEAAVALQAVQDKRTPARKTLPEHLPREEITHAAPCACPRCGGKLSKLGEDVTEVLDYLPARFKVIRHVRPKFSCRACEAITQAPAPALPIERGKPGPGLLAHVLVSKFCDHLPLYRQSAIYAREGVDLERSTLADWVGRSAALLRPLAEALADHVMAGPVLHGDDTPVPVLSPGHGKTREGRFWVYVRNERPHAGEAAPAVAYFYSPDRKGERPQSHLQAFRGVLHADGYAGYNRLYEQGRIREAACMAHVRRKFFDVAAAMPSPIATEAVARIAQLYQIEENIRGQPPDLRRTARQARSKPIFDDLIAWLEHTKPMLSGKSELAKAIRYALSRKDALARFLDDGRVEIDNSAAERALRGVALGRKNYLFIGSDDAGARAATIYSLIETAKLNGVDPEAWLADVLARIADHPNRQINELLPWSWAQQRQQNAA